MSESVKPCPLKPTQSRHAAVSTLPVIDTLRLTSVKKMHDHEVETVVTQHDTYDMSIVVLVQYCFTPSPDAVVTPIYLGVTGVR